MCCNICRHRSARHCSEAEQQIPAALGDYLLTQKLIITQLLLLHARVKGAQREETKAVRVVWILKEKT